MEWKQRSNRTLTFQLEDEPEFIHITKVGFENEYFITFEDAYELCNGMEVLSLSKEEIKLRFNIDVEGYGL